METFVVHFEIATCKGVKRGKRTVKARNMWEAKMKVSARVNGAFGLWV